VTNDDEDIRAVICDFGLAVMGQSRIGRAPQLQALKGFSFLIFFFLFFLIFSFSFSFSLIFFGLKFKTIKSNQVFQFNMHHQKYFKMLKNIFQNLMIKEILKTQDQDLEHSHSQNPPPQLQRRLQLKQKKVM